MRRAAAAAIATSIAAVAPLGGGGAQTLLLPSEGAIEALEAAFDPAGRLTAPVFVNGRGPYQFTVDTGADRTVISDDLAARLALPPGPTVILHDIVGSERIGTAVVARLGVGSREISNVSAAILSRTNLGAAGMLGIDSVADQRVVLDFKARRIEVQASPRERERDEPGTIVVHGKRRFGQLVLVDARFRGRKVYVIVDTGAECSVGNPALRRLVSRRAKVDAVDIVSVTGRKATGDEVVLPEITLGAVTLSELHLAFADLHTFRRFGLADQPAMLLGMDVLRAFERVSIDFVRKKARFRLPPTRSAAIAGASRLR